MFLSPYTCGGRLWVTGTGVLMNETLPLLTQIKHGRHPGVLHELRDVTLSLPIPAAYQANPSPPISADVSLVHLLFSLTSINRFE